MSLVGEIESVLFHEPADGAIAFRPMDVYDAEHVYAWLSAEETFRQLHWRPRSVDEARLRIELWTNSEDAVHLVVLHHGQEAGFLHIEHFDPYRRQCWLTLFVIDPTRIDRGLGTRTLTLLLNRLWDSGIVEHVLLAVDAANERALTVYRRLGFEPIDQRTQHYPEGLIVEQLIMECDLNRFPA